MSGKRAMGKPYISLRDSAVAKEEKESDED